ncbi:ATP-binding protein [Apilactobacillus zhangqiuensis]|uniref:ATP-binding protein n=1 Tax=Apilactobacillus zhangqiuensis TaxID=2841031 RepID=UPI001C7DA3E0|nr:AAA family ATPase [Apilactobacillus zhangqiuensis]
MKINKLEVLGYGKWHDVTFDFNDDNLQIIFGNNEAGKTTLLSLIEGILFGYVDGRGSSYEQYIPRDTKSYGGKLTITTDDNRHFILTRIAGTHGGELSIYDVDNDMQTANDILDKIVGPIDRDTFEQLFYFGDLDIKQISKLSKNELVSRIQKVGFVGSDQWLELRDKFDKEAKDLYAPTGRKPPLNKKLKEYDVLLDRIAESKNSLKDYNQLISQKNALEAAINQSKQKANDLEKKVTELNHFKQLWPVYQQLSSLKQNNFEFKDGFSDNDVKEFNELTNQLFLINQQIDSIEKSINQLNDSMNDDADLQSFNNHKNEIDKLVQSFSKVNEQINQLSVNQSMINEINRQDRQQVIANRDDISAVGDIRQQIEMLQSTKTKSSSGISIIGIIGLIVGIALLTVLPGVMKVLGIIVLLLSGIYTGSVKFKKNEDSNSNQKRDELNNQLLYYGNKYSFNAENVDDWLSEQKYLARKTQDNNQKAKYEDEMNQLNEGLKSYFAEWQRVFSGLNVNDSFDNQLSQIRTHLNKMNEENAINLRNNNQLQNYLQQKSALIDKQIQYKKEYAEFLETRKVDNGDEFKEVVEEQRKHSIKEAQLQNVKNQITEDDVKALSAFKDLEELSSKLNDFNAEMTTEKQSLLNNSQHLESLNIQLKHVIADGTYNELVQKQRNLEAEINDMVDQWMSMKLANSWIDESLNIATADRIPLFESKAKEFFAILTDNRYTGITYYKSKLKVTRDDKVQFDAGELSRGTIEQLYLALILSLSVVFGRDYRLPLIIDDGLTEFDQQRTGNAIKLLERISETMQVIYVTCDSDILKLVEDKAILNLNEQ